MDFHSMKVFKNLRGVFKPSVRMAAGYISRCGSANFKFSKVQQIN